MDGRSSWMPVAVQSAARVQSLVLAGLATACWIWFGYAVHGGLDASSDGGVPASVAVSLAVAVAATVFSAALTVVAWLASIAGELVVRVDQDAKARARQG